MSTPRMKVWRSTVGRGFSLHSLKQCTGGPGARNLRVFRITQEQYDAALAERKVVALGGPQTGLRLCKCVGKFRPENTG